VGLTGRHCQPNGYWNEFRQFKAASTVPNDTFGHAEIVWAKEVAKAALRVG
jgi:hypothetical protein